MILIGALPGVTTFSTAKRSLQPLAEVEVGDFANGRYDLLAAVVEGEVAQLELLRRGTVQMAGETWPILVHKAISYQPRQGSCFYSYRLQNLGHKSWRSLLPLNLTLTFGRSSFRPLLFGAGPHAAKSSAEFPRQNGKCR